MMSDSGKKPRKNQQDFFSIDTCVLRCDSFIEYDSKAQNYREMQNITRFICA